MRRRSMWSGRSASHASISFSGAVLVDGDVDGLGAIGAQRPSHVQGAGGGGVELVDHHDAHVRRGHGRA